MARKAAPVRSPYGVHPGVKMVRDWIDTLPEKTGRSLDQWIALVQDEGPPTEKERREWLKERHKLGTNSAWWLAQRAEGKGTEEDDPESYLRAATGYVEAMFAGPKAGLRPIYERLLEVAIELGEDVKACPCQTIVPLYRHHVFAQIKPSTRTRIDFGLALKGAPGPLPDRLIDTGGLAKKDRITHRFAIGALDVIDAEVRRWLRVAYDLDR